MGLGGYRVYYFLILLFRFKISSLCFHFGCKFRFFCVATLFSGSYFDAFTTEVIQVMECVKLLCM